MRTIVNASFLWTAVAVLMSSMFLAAGQSALAGEGLNYPMPNEVYYVVACTGAGGDQTESPRESSCAVRTLEARRSGQPYRNAETPQALQQSAAQ